MINVKIHGLYFCQGSESGGLGLFVLTPELESARFNPYYLNSVDARLIRRRNLISIERTPLRFSQQPPQKTRNARSDRSTSRNSLSLSSKSFPHKGSHRRR